MDHRPQQLSMAFTNVTRQLSTDGNRLVSVSGHYAKCQPRTVTWAVEGSLQKMFWTCCVRYSERAFVVESSKTKQRSGMCFLAGCLSLSASCEYSEPRAKLRFSTNRKSVTFSKFQNRLRNDNALQCCFLNKSVDLCCGLRIRFTHELRSCNFLWSGKKHAVQSRGRRRNARQLVGQIGSAR